MIDQSEELLYNNSSDAENDQNKNEAKWGKITKSFSTIVASVEDNESVITCLAKNPVISQGEIISYFLFFASHSFCLNAYKADKTTVHLIYNILNDFFLSLSPLSLSPLSLSLLLFLLFLYNSLFV